MQTSASEGQYDGPAAQDDCTLSELSCYVNMHQKEGSNLKKKVSDLSGC